MGRPSISIYIYCILYFIFPCISWCQEHFTRVVQEKRELKDYADRVTRELRRQRVGVLHWENVENPTRSAFGTSQREINLFTSAPEEDERQLSL